MVTDVVVDRVGNVEGWNGPQQLLAIRSAACTIPFRIPSDAGALQWFAKFSLYWKRRLLPLCLHSDVGSSTPLRYKIRGAGYGCGVSLERFCHA